MALSLGEAHGNVVLGKPIDLVFDIQTDQGVGLDATCISASAFAGETRIDSSRLRITALPVVAGRPFSIRVQSSAVVAEPVLTVRITADCSGATARTYDFLADAPSGSGAAFRALPLVIVSPKVAPVIEPVAPPKNATATQANAPTKAPLAPPLSAPEAPLEVPSPSPSEQQAQAAELLQAQARLQQQQTEIDAVRASREKLQVVVAQLEQRLERLDSNRFPAEWVYALLALLAVAFALLGWQWLHSRTQRPLQGQNQKANSLEAFNAQSDIAVSDSPDLLLKASVPSASLAPTPAVTPIPVATAPGSLDLTLAAPALVSAVRMLNPEELFDLQQQADFFVSVGEYEQAIGVMKKHIAENKTASPLMYLELLRLYHSLSRRDDFKRLQTQFQQHFNALVPEFSAFQTGGRTLLDYPETAASIEAIWSDNAVLSLLENSIFRGNSGTVEPFELPAYDDLLLLYAIANTTPARARGAPSPRTRTMPYTATA